jgi:hypothetical protein
VGHRLNPTLTSPAATRARAIRDQLAVRCAAQILLLRQSTNPAAQQALADLLDALDRQAEERTTWTP